MSVLAPAPLALQGRHLLELADLDAGELAGLLRLAHLLKQEAPIFERTLLRGRTLALLFEKPSLRTRISFEVAMQRLGGATLFAAGGEFLVGARETPEDAARVLSRYVDAIVVRTHAHAPLQRFAAAAAVPVINGLSAAAHPAQALADLLTIEERFGTARGLTVAFLGDARNNVAASLSEAVVLLGGTIRFGCPRTHRPDAAMLARLARLGEVGGGQASIIHEPARAVRGADVVYTDVWTSMGDERFRERNNAMLLPFGVTSALMREAAPHAVFMHCLPAHRGEEVSADVIDGKCSVVLDQAENRLHAQKALLVALLADAREIPL